MNKLLNSRTIIRSVEYFIIVIQITGIINSTVDSLTNKKIHNVKNSKVNNQTIVLKNIAQIIDCSKIMEKAKLTPKQSEKIVGNIVGVNNYKIACEYDHSVIIDGILYHVIHVYEKMQDHINTVDWYYINAETGKVFVSNSISGELIPIH